MAIMMFYLWFATALVVVVVIVIIYNFASFSIGFFSRSCVRQKNPVWAMHLLVVVVGIIFTIVVVIVIVIVIIITSSAASRFTCHLLLLFRVAATPCSFSADSSLRCEPQILALS